jgi:hypothetical protein
LFSVYFTNRNVEEHRLYSFLTCLTWLIGKPVFAAGWIDQCVKDKDEVFSFLKVPFAKGMLARMQRKSGQKSVLTFTP